MVQWKKIPVTIGFGGISSLCILLFTIGTWRGGTEVFIGNIAYAMYLIPVVFAIVAALVEKRRRQGVLGFRPALTICFGIIVLSLAVQRVFTWILVHLIDPAFGRTLGPAVLANTEAAYRRFGMPEDEISTNIAAAKNSDPFGFGSMALGLAYTYVLFFLIAVLLAAIIRRNSPAEGPYKKS
jgi:hypothetical protein